MDNMIKQMRVKFSGIDEGETSHDRNRKLPPQKTRSFKGDSRRSQNWYRRQSSRGPVYDYDSDYMEGDEFRTAVAAAAFAVNSVEERRRSARRKHDDSSRTPERKQEDGAVSAPRRAREKLLSSSASNKMKNKEDDTVPISTPRLMSKISSELQGEVPQRANSSSNTEPKEPIFMSTTSFDKQSDKREPESGLASSSTSQKPTDQPTFRAIEVHRKRPEQRPEDIKADVWEKTEMERIKERYEKLNAKILEWENEKKAKAKKKLSRNKDEREKKRARALQDYKTQMEIIDQIAQGARAQAEENRRKEEIKVKKKAEMIRLTGKIPTKTCVCF